MNAAQGVKCFAFASLDGAGTLGLAPRFLMGHPTRNL
jgi:hypothetical protein